MCRLLPFVQMCSRATAGVWHPQLPEKAASTSFTQISSILFRMLCSCSWDVGLWLSFQLGNKINAIPSLEGTTDWQIAIVDQERQFCGSCSIMDKHLEYVRPKHEIFWDKVNIKRSWVPLLPNWNFIGLTLLPGTNWWWKGLDYDLDVALKKLK